MNRILSKEQGFVLVEDRVADDGGLSIANELYVLCGVAAGRDEGLEIKLSKPKLFERPVNAFRFVDTAISTNSHLLSIFGNDIKLVWLNNFVYFEDGAILSLNCWPKY